MKRLIIFLILCSTALAAYEPFPIFDMRAGKVTAADPWLLPKDAFETLRNCHLKDGVLEKRRGYSSFGQMLHAATDTKNPTLKTSPIMGIYNWYSGATEQLIIMDQDRIAKYEDSYVTSVSVTKVVANGSDITCTTAASHGLVVGDMITYTTLTGSDYDGTYDVTAIDDTTPGFSFDITATFDATSTATAAQEPFNDLTTLKIKFTNHDDYDDPCSVVQVHALVVGDTLTGAGSGATATVIAITVDTGAWASNTACGTIHLSDLDTGSDQSGTFEDEDITDGTNVVGHVWGDSDDEEFSGDNTDFFWVENWKEISYITNNEDPIQKYDGTTLTQLNIDLDVEGGSYNDITRCRLIFAIKNRLVLFDIDDTSITYRQRARWCEINDPDTWKSASWVDAPTEEWIIAADFIGDDLIVFFERSVWKFSYTGDPDYPFRWDKVDAVEGCYATMSLVAFSDEIFGVGATKLIGTDGREAYSVDEKIPEFVMSWVIESAPYSYGLVLEEERQAWISYTSTSASANADGNKYADSALILGYEDNSFSTYELPIHSMGYSALESDLTWNTVLDAWEDIDWAWNDKSIQAGYPTTLMGSQDGFVYKLNDTGADNGSDIEFNATTGRWNPYTLNQARLGWVDFLVDKDSGASFDVKFYLDTETTSYQTSSISCTETGTAREKVWKRANCGAVGDFHRLNITNSASTNRPRIHAIVPFFKKAGSLY